MFIGYVVWMVINLDSVLLMIILIFVIALILFLTTYLIIKKTKTNKIKKEIEKLDIERNLLVGVPILTELSKVKDLVKTDNLKEKPPATTNSGRLFNTSVRQRNYDLNAYKL